MARKVAIWLFGAFWVVSWSWVDNLAATVVRVRHDGMTGSFDTYSLYEGSELL